MINRTQTEEETRTLGEEFAHMLKGGEVVFLQGDLGAGKTTFTRGVARALGFGQPVRSPSFTIVNRYPVEAEAIRQILHVDLYRMEDPSEIPPLALEEEMGLPDTVTFIEWPQKGGDHVTATHVVTFTQTETGRDIHIETV